MAEEQLRTAALEYHEFPTTPGKISVLPTKALAIAAVPDGYPRHRY
jgi:Malate dehydrogenase enzyme